MKIRLDNKNIDLIHKCKYFVRGDKVVYFYLRSGKVIRRKAHIEIEETLIIE